MRKVFNIHVNHYSVYTLGVRVKNKVFIEQLIDVNEPEFDNEFVEAFKAVILEEILECFSRY